MRPLIRARRQKILERCFADSGRSADVVPRLADRSPPKKAHRNPAAGADAARPSFLSTWVEDQTSPFSFPLSGSKQGQDEKVCENIDDAARQDDRTKTLRWRKIRQNENGEASGNDDVGVNNAAPLLFPRSDPGSPSFFAVALGAADAKDQVNHGVDGDTDADISGGCRDHIHRNVEPAYAAEHAERH